MENSYQKFAKDTLIIGITTFLILLVGLIQLPLLTKTLGAHDYGIWAQVGVTISLALAFVDLSLTRAMVRFLPAEKNKEVIQDDFYSVVSIVFFCGLIVLSVMIAFPYPLAMNFFDGAVQVVRIIGAIILTQLLSLAYLSFLRTFQQMRRYSIFVIARGYGQLGLIAYLILNGYGILGVVLSVLAIEVVILFILFFLIRSQIGIKKPHFSRMKEYLSYGLPTIPGNLAYWVVQSSDRYVIGYFLGVTSVGIYSAAYGLGSLVYIISGILAFVLPPALAKLYDEGRMNEVKTHLSYSLKYSLTVAIPFIFGSAILGEPVLRMFSTSEIASEGGFIVPLIALGISFYGVYVMPLQNLLLAKKTKILAAIWITAALVNLGLNILVVPLWGILGAAITTLIAFALALGLTTYYSLKEFRFPVDWRFIIKSLIASGIMSVVIWVMHPQSNSATIITVLAGIAVYGVAIILLKGFRREEISFFRGLFQRSPPAANPNDDKAK